MTETFRLRINNKLPMKYCAFFHPWPNLRSWRCPSPLARITAKRRCYEPRRAFWEIWGLSLVCWFVCLCLCVCVCVVSVVCLLACLWRSFFCCVCVFVLNVVKFGMFWCLPSCIFFWWLPVFFNCSVFWSCCVSNYTNYCVARLIASCFCYVIWLCFLN